MWLLERRRDVVRIGRAQVEWWACEPEGLVLRAQQPLDGAAVGDVAALEAALSQVLDRTGADGSLRKPSPRLDAVLESAWLPVLALDIGQALWSRRQLEALLRHRLGQLYGEREVQAWDLQLDHRAGDAHGLGYGLAPVVKQAVDRAVAAAGVRLASLQPALAWGWQRLKTHRRRRRTGWWLWLEQDRSLVGRVECSRLSLLNAGAPVPCDGAQALRLIEIEAVRQGVSETQLSGVVAGWAHAHGAHSKQLEERGMSWVGVAAGPDAALDHAALNAGSFV